MTLAPRFTLDQLAALVAAAEAESLGAAAARLHLSEPGLRSRLLGLERALGESLYVKQQGRRGRLELTPAGLAWIERARDLLAQARQLDGAVLRERHEVHVAASQYLAYYVLIDTIRAFRARFPKTVVRLSTRIEAEIERTMLEEPVFELGFCASAVSDPRLAYRHWFDLDWSFVAPRRHPLASRRRVSIRDVADEPLILFEQGSAGRDHQLDAFRALSLVPRVEMEASTTAVVLKMVEAGLGVSVLPLLPSGATTRGLDVAVIPLGRQVRPIASGVLSRRNVPLSPAARALVEFAQARRL